MADFLPGSVTHKFLDTHFCKPPEIAIQQFSKMVSINKYREVGKSLRRVDLADNSTAIFEFKKVFEMPIGRLKHLHGTTIEVELEIQGTSRSVTGQGNYDEKDPDLGSVLRIQVSDPSGDFEFLIPESNWSGCLESSDLPGCDYRISLSSCTSC